MALLLSQVQQVWYATLTGQQIDGQVGTIRADWHIDSAQGTTVPNSILALSGLQINSASGTLTYFSSDGGAQLTGQASTSAAGTLVPISEIFPSGHAATFAQGAPGLDIACLLAGSLATGSTGTLVPNENVTSTGSAATGAAGTVGPVSTILPTGLQSASAAGDVDNASDVPLLGSASTSATGNVTVGSDDVTEALTGQSATLSAGDILSGQGLSGQASTGAAGSLGVSSNPSLEGQQVGGSGSLGGEQVYRRKAFPNRPLVAQRYPRRVR